MLPLLPFLALLAAQTPGPAAPRVLTLDEALRAALAAQPSVRQARAQSRAAEARVGQARAPLLPQVTSTLAYQRTTANFAPRPGSLPSSIRTETGTSFDTFNYFNGSVTASQLIWDFGQASGRLRSAEQASVAQSLAERASTQQAAFGVRSAYFGARGARALLEVAESTLANQRRHLAQAQGFYEVGTRPRLDVVQAQSNVANAQLQLIQARNDYQSSKAQLNAAMGRDGPGDDFEVSDETLPELEGEGRSYALLLEEAVAARPEIAQLEAQIRAQEATLSSVRGERWPALGAATGLTSGGQSLSSLAWNWNAQATLTWPLFQGLLVSGQIAEAEAILESVKTQRDAVRQQVSLEVEQARLAVGAARAALSAAGEALDFSRDSLALAEGRYQTGAGNILELNDAQTNLTHALGQRVRAEYDLSVARAQLLRALGRP